MSLARLGLALALHIACERSAEAGPWLASPGHGYLLLREEFSIADARFDASGARQPIFAATSSGGRVTAAYRLLDTNLYCEITALARLGFVVDAVAVRAVWQPTDAQTTSSAVGISDVTVGAKLLVFDDVLTLSLLALVTAPTGSTTDRLPLGQGDVRSELALVVGKLFEPLPLFIAASFGFVLRGSATVTDPAQPTERTTISYAPEVRYLVEAGYAFRRNWRALQRIYVIVRLEGRYSSGVFANDGLGTLTPPSSAFLRIGGEIAWMPIHHLEVGISAGSFVAGRSLPAMSAIGLTFGIPY